MYDISKIPEELQRGFKRNRTIKYLIDYANAEIENLPKGQLDYIFSRDLDVITKSLKKYGFGDFANKIREFKKTHKRCPNCGLIYGVRINSVIYNCPVCIKFNDQKNAERIQKMKANTDYQKVGKKISAALKNMPPEKKRAIREKAHATIKDRYGVDYMSSKQKERWAKVDGERRKEIGKKISETKLNWGPEEREHFRKAQRETWSQKTPGELRSIEEKKKATNLKKYGYCSNFQDPTCRKKIKEKNLEIYGKENPMQKPAVKKKRDETMQGKYGTTHPLQNPSIKEKMKKTAAQKTRAEWEEIRKKTKNTNIEKFGTEHPAQQHIKNFDIYHTKEGWVENVCEIWRGDKAVVIQKAQEFFNITGTQVRAKAKSFGLPIYRGIIHKAESKFIEALGIPGIQRQHKIGPYRVDAYDPQTNTIYEFLGDYWHGNLDIFDESAINANNKISFGDLHTQTFKRLRDLVDAGYCVKYIWESEFADFGISALQNF